MQIYVKNAAGNTLLSAEGGKHTVSYYDNILSIHLNENEEVKVECNGIEEEFTEKGEHIFPIFWDRTNSCSIIVRGENIFSKYVFSLDNTKLPDEVDVINLYKFMGQIEETFRVDEEYSILKLFEAIQKDEVSLIIEKKPFAGYDDQTLLRKISETVPMVMDICSHPKQSLRTDEAILDVNLVKRINSRTMDHLASHSEHWKARTLNGLIPNRLRADIIEDEINIYENLFFKMAVGDVLKYVHRQAKSIEKTIQQNDCAIDWNAYGESLSDYKRMRIFKQLLPDYGVGERQNENDSLKKLYDSWCKIEKNFSTVEASQFYRSIDKKKHISRNIQPTNILKKDSRYNALYRLWCEIHRQVVQDQQDSLGLIDSVDVSISECYTMYVIILLLYVFKLLECELNNQSVFKLQLDGSMHVNARFDTGAMIYHVSTERNRFGATDISLTFVEKQSYRYAIPELGLRYIEDIRKLIPDGAEIDHDEKVIVFHKKPSLEEQKELKNAFHINQAAQKGMSKEEKETKKQIDKVWRSELESLFASNAIKELRSEHLYIRPQYAFMEDSEVAVDKCTKAMLDSSVDQSVYIVPIDISDFKKNIKSSKLISRLLSYGEKYEGEDADKWGDYKSAILPSSQGDINSAQRLMKLVSVHTARLLIRWNKEKKYCPICGGTDCNEESRNSWRCKNPECGVIFGITKHANGCGCEYEWTRPFVEIKRQDISNIDAIGMVLKKEVIFDRLTITDFEFEEQEDGRIKYIPICPKCGKR